MLDLTGVSVYNQPMFLDVILFLAGLLLLYYGADYLVAGSSRLALSYGIRPLIIGMTVVAFATSMPEMMVSLMAAFKGSSDIAAGNIVGSNIANIGLILGVAAIASPITVAAGMLRREFPFLVGATILLCVLSLNGVLGFFDGLLLFVLLLAFIGYCMSTARSRCLDQPADSSVVEEESRHRGKDVVLILFGIAGLGIGAELMVFSAVSIARTIGVSELIIGVSIVALGTSLPELAASMVSAWKGEMDLSIGNVIGSNIFNILFVLGVCPMIHPLTIDPDLLQVKMPIMIGFTLGLVLLVSRRMVLGRIHGIILLTAYIIFIASLFI